MDIAALSMGLSQMKVAQQASVSVMKMAMDTAEGQASDLTEMLASSTQSLEASVSPHVGTKIDVSV